eukprot:708639-Pyramimonas_sp.AAC.1
MPVLFHVVRTGDDGLKEFLFQQFTHLVAIIRQHIRRWELSPSRLSNSPSRMRTHRPVCKLTVPYANSPS